jgi:hypothetical protein
MYFGLSAKGAKCNSLGQRAQDGVIKAFKR